MSFASLSSAPSGLIKRENFCLAWAAFGLYFFLSAFFWASGPAPLRTVFYLFLLIPFLLVLPWRKFRGEEYGSHYTLAALTFAGYSVLASLWGDASAFGFFFKQWVFLAFWLCGLSWLFYHRPVDLQRLYLMIMIVGAVCALGSVYYFYIYQQHPIALRLNGLGLSENSTVVAQIFGVAALLAYIGSLQTSNWKLSPLYFMLALACAVPVLMSQTRGTAVALILVGIVAALIVRPQWRIWVSQMVLAIVVITALFLLTDMVDVLQARGISLSYRDVIWLELLERAQENPVFGIGYAENSRIVVDAYEFHHAHNSWVDILYYGGLVGLALSMWHGLLLLRGFSRDEDILPLYLWLAYGCICLFSNGSSLLTRPDQQWFMYWVPAGILAAVVMSRRRCQT